MTTTKSILVRATSVSICLTLLSIAFMELWVFEDTRQAAADFIGRSQASLWFPIAALIGLSQAGFLWFSIARISDPLVSLTRKAETERLGFSFQTKSKLVEEDRLQTALERQSLKIQELEQQIDEIDQKLETSQNEHEETQGELQEAIEKRDLFAKQIEEQLTSIESLNSEVEKLEQLVDEERKAKVSREVEKRTEEIYNQMEKAVEASALKSIWVPHFVHEISSSAKNINRLSDKLVSQFEELSLARIQIKLEEILEHSRGQLEELENLSQAEAPQEQDPKAERRSISRKSPSEETVPPKAKSNSRFSLKKSPEETPVAEEAPVIADAVKTTATEEVNIEEAAPIEAIAPETVETEATPLAETPEPLTEESESSSRLDTSLLDEPIKLSVDTKFDTPEPKEDSPRFKLDEPISTEFDTSLLDEPITLGGKKDDSSHKRISLDETRVENSDPRFESSSPADQIDLQSLVVETLSCCPNMPVNVEVKVSIQDDLEAIVSRQELHQSLKDLVEVSVFQTASGYVDLEIGQKGEHLEFSATSIGELHSPESIDLTQANRIASMAEGKYEIDMDHAAGPRMYFRHPLATAKTTTIELN